MSSQQSCSCQVDACVHKYFDDTAEVGSASSHRQQCLLGSSALAAMLATIVAVVLCATLGKAQDGSTHYTSPPVYPSRKFLTL